MCAGVLAGEGLLVFVDIQTDTCVSREFVLCASDEFAVLENGVCEFISENASNLLPTSFVLFYLF